MPTEKEPCPYLSNCDRRSDAEKRNVLVSLDRLYCEWPGHVNCPNFLQYESEKQSVFSQGGLAVLAR